MEHTQERCELIQLVLFPDRCWHKQGAGYNPDYFSETSNDFWEMKREVEEQKWYKTFISLQIGRHVTQESDIGLGNFIKRVINPEAFSKLLSDFLAEMILKEREETCPICVNTGSDCEAGTVWIKFKWAGEYLIQCPKCEGTGKRWAPRQIELSESINKTREGEVKL